MKRASNHTVIGGCGSLNLFEGKSVKIKYEKQSSELHRPFRNKTIYDRLTKNTWQGVYFSGEVKVRSQSESESPAVYQGSGYESARVTRIVPETCRSSPG